MALFLLQSSKCKTEAGSSFCCSLCARRVSPSWGVYRFNVFSSIFFLLSFTAITVTFLWGVSAWQEGIQNTLVVSSKCVCTREGELVHYWKFCLGDLGTMHHTISESTFLYWIVWALLLQPSRPRTWSLLKRLIRSDSFDQEESELLPASVLP